MPEHPRGDMSMRLCLVNTEASFGRFTTTLT